MNQAELSPATVAGGGISLHQILDELWSHRWLGLGTAWLFGLVMAALLWFVPDRYETKARVYVDTQTIIQPLLQGLTSQPDLDQTVTMLARTLVTRSNIDKILVSTGIDKTIKSPQARERMIDGLQKGIKFNSVVGKNVYDVSYRDSDGARGLKIVEALVNLFFTAGADDKARGAEEARKFFDEQIAEHEKKLSEAETRLKNFKISNMSTNGMGAATGPDFYSRLGSLEQDLAATRVDLNGAEQSRDVLARQVESERSTPTMTVNAAVADFDQRIDAQQRTIDDLRRRYTDAHPDVVEAQRVLSQLKEDRIRVSSDLRTGKSLPSEIGNVALQQMKVKLAEADAAVGNLRGRFNSITVRLNEMRAEASQIPGQEAELARLNRDYDVIKRNYETLVQRREAASLSGSVDADAHLAEFRVIEAPRLEPHPVFPSHTLLVPLALLFSMAAGLAAALRASLVMGIIQSPRDLRSMKSRPVLGAISFVTNEAQQARERQLNLYFYIAMGALVVFYLLWMGSTLFRASPA